MQLIFYEFWKLSKIGFFLKKKTVFSKKTFSVLDNANGLKLAVECNWFSEISQNVENLGFLRKKTRWVFRKRCEFSLKIANGTIFALPCDWNSKNQQNVQKNGVLKKLDGFFREKIHFSKKTAKDCKFCSRMRLNQ